MLLQSTQRLLWQLSFLSFLKYRMKWSSSGWEVCIIHNCIISKCRISFSIFCEGQLQSQSMSQWYSFYTTFSQNCVINLEKKQFLYMVNNVVEGALCKQCFLSVNLFMHMHLQEKTAWLCPISVITNRLQSLMCDLWNCFLRRPGWCLFYKWTKDVSRAGFVVSLPCVSLSFCMCPRPPVWTSMSFSGDKKKRR